MFSAKNSSPVGRIWRRLIDVSFVFFRRQKARMVGSKRFSRVGSKNFLGVLSVLRVLVNCVLLLIVRTGIFSRNI